MSSGGDGIGYDGRYVDANEGNACGHGISVCQYAMTGEHDDSLKCPVNVKFIMELVNQTEEKNKELSDYVEWHRPKSLVLALQMTELPEVLCFWPASSWIHLQKLQKGGKPV